MKTEIYWIPGTWPGRLAIMPRPRGGDWLADEVRAWREAGVGVVVSLLESEEIMDLNLTQEEEFCRANRVEFLAFPIEDRGVPESRESVADLVPKLAGFLKGGKNVAIHCRQGIGRAATIASCVLVALGTDPETAMTSIGTARGCVVPETPEQRLWVTDFARTLLTARTQHG